MAVMDGRGISNPIIAGQAALRPRVLTQQNIDTIVIFERLGAALSASGILLIFVAYAAFKRLRTVPNTFIVFASVANLGASIACLIGYSGVVAGSTSPLCQAQAFLFELFMQSDPWWSLAMAVNVYMVFFFSANPKSFLRYWWVYCCVCYGIPFIPALWLLFVQTSDGNHIYGNATIWCWIGEDSSNLRIYTYYLPIWVCIILSSCIYVAVGYHVFKQRNQLRNLSLSNPTHDPPPARDSGDKDLFTNAAVMGRINREVVQVTTVNSSTTAYAGEGSVSGSCSSSSSSSSSTGAPGAAPASWFDGPASDKERRARCASASSRCRCGGDGAGSPAPAPPCPYYRYQTTVTRITADPAPRRPGAWARGRAACRRLRARLHHVDPVKLAYLRTSFVFAISVFVTWTPSSVNRVHDLASAASGGGGGEPGGSGGANFALNLASAVVLPLQGVWNAVIFFSTGWAALRQEARARADECRGIPRGQRAAAAARRERELELEIERRRAAAADDARAADEAAAEPACPGAPPRDDAASEPGASSSTARGTVRVLRGGSLSSL
ncbi:hypothetical protein GGS23DRAFT_615980 [Durotheca rogersii]|uniref:uncharacterized protein n=1 Tax=Durotheca rogersii TaxID=419775 RepID=UPI002220DE25|nr:uncharacterized protein GGS23DRAFT_615980 [Durotheca rogersii]KAI5859578.1 hypothetical protein GGS23DRAFT_615980 [Durotheca rogersii]